MIGNHCKQHQTGFLEQARVPLWMNCSLNICIILGPHKESDVVQQRLCVHPYMRK